jgi:hypothetical protein
VPGDRLALIERKEEVRSQIARLRRQLSALGDDPRRQRRRAELEGELEALMAEEGRLRVLIDRASRA